MSNVIRFAMSGKPQVAGPAEQSQRGVNAADISRMVGIALNAQLIARRGIIVALFNLEMALVNCRKAIALLPEGEDAERTRLNDDLCSVEKSLEEVRSIARSL